MKSPFRTHNGFDWVDGRIVCHADERHGNLAGTIHGGVALTMLDSVMGGSVIAALPEGQAAVTSSITTHFLRPAHVGDVLVASATIRRLGRTLAYVDGTLVREADGAELVTATGVFAIVAVPS